MTKVFYDIWPKNLITYGILERLKDKFELHFINLGLCHVPNLLCNQ